MVTLAQEKQSQEIALNVETYREFYDLVNNYYAEDTSDLVRAVEVYKAINTYRSRLMSFMDYEIGEFLVRLYTQYMQGQIEESVYKRVNANINKSLYDAVQIKGSMDVLRSTTWDQVMVASETGVFKEYDQDDERFSDDLVRAARRNVFIKYKQVA